VTHAPASAAAVPLSALLASCGRIVQALQYGVVLYAVGGVATASTALMAQGIQLVGASVGDLVPGQMGATEGAFRAFAGALGLGAEPARALSIALVIRMAQLGLAVSCLLVAALVRRQPRAGAGAGATEAR